MKVRFLCKHGIMAVVPERLHKRGPGSIPVLSNCTIEVTPVISEWLGRGQPSTIATFHLFFFREAGKFIK